MSNDFVWRITEDDFEMVIKENHPELSDEQVKGIIENAKRNFSIDNWQEQISDFVELKVEDIKEKDGKTTRLKQLKELKAIIQNPETQLAEYKYYNTENGCRCVIGHLLNINGFNFKNFSSEMNNEEINYLYANNEEVYEALKHFEAHDLVELQVLNDFSSESKKSIIEYINKLIGKEY